MDSKTLKYRSLFERVFCLFDKADEMPVSTILKDDQVIKISSELKIIDIQREFTNRSLIAPGKRWRKLSNFDSLISAFRNLGSTKQQNPSSVPEIAEQPKPVVKSDIPKTAQIVIATEAELSLLSISSAVISLDIEGFHDSSFAILSISLYPTKDAILIDRQMIGEKTISILLQRLRLSPSLKIILVHECHGDTLYLGKEFIHTLQQAGKKFLDIQLVYEYFNRDFAGGFQKTLHFFSSAEEIISPNLKGTTRSYGSALWFHRPLSSQLIEFAGSNVILMQQCFSPILRRLQTADEPNLLDKLCLATRIRLIHAFQHPNSRQITFLPDSFTKLSAELSISLGHRADFSGVNDSIQCFSSTGHLISFLPEKYRTQLVACFEENYIDKNVCDIVMDLGKSSYMTRLQGGGRETIFPSGSQDIVTKEELEEFITNSNISFGPDNRAGIPNELHRISCIRNKNRHIIGLTIRIGRFFKGNTYLISDLLFAEEFKEKSILVLGPPGSGKTSLIRELARQLAEESNVMIVDTSNEIAGDSDIPHSCVGRARRMMVTDIDEQYSIMRECVQNHTPDVMIIDEIGRYREVQAAKTCKERGVKLIASAHGEFRTLLKNKELNGLIGGVTATMLGDAAAKENNGKKLKAEREHQPIFDIVIELEKGEYNRCRVIKNSGEAVDSILEGNKFRAELRERILLNSPDTNLDDSTVDETDLLAANFASHSQAVSFSLIDM